MAKARLFKKILKSRAYSLFAAKLNRKQRQHLVDECIDFGE